MTYETLLKLRSNPDYIRFIRENSEWYKILNRDPDMFDSMVNAMKEKYQKRPGDKLDKISTGLDLLSLFMDSNE